MYLTSLWLIYQKFQGFTIYLFDKFFLHLYCIIIILCSIVLTNNLLQFSYTSFRSNIIPFFKELKYYNFKLKFAIINYLQFKLQKTEPIMTIVIQNYQFDLSIPIYLITPTNKFWEAILINKTLKLKVGKIKNQMEQNIEQISKVYPTAQLARASMIEKIREKLIKGYFSKQAKQVTVPEINNLKRPDKINQPPKLKRRDYSGEYYQKGINSIKLEISQNRVKVTRVSNTQSKTQIKKFQNHQASVQYCLKEQQWLLGQGYIINNSKFLYSFIEDDEPYQKDIKRPTKKSTNNRNNLLSIVGMTDDAISRSSRQSRDFSQTKSNRSAYDNDFQSAQFKSSALGPPTTTCIKVLLAETWDDSKDPTNWYMSQKLDGVRCFWTGTQMFSRNGNRFYCPKFFTKNWPKSQMDGQLFIGRNKFSETISAIKKSNPIDSQWEKVCYLVFDAPALKKTFKERVQIMEQVITNINSPYLKCHAHRICKDYSDMFNQLESVNKIKGQGLMLRDPNSYYENRRSKSLLKVKVFYDDQATVIGYKDGTGRCHGMVGALRVRNTHGVQFEVGSGMNDDLRRNPPAIGSIITYKYQQFNSNSGKPRFPIFLRIYQPL